MMIPSCIDELGLASKRKIDTLNISCEFDGDRRREHVPKLEGTYFSDHRWNDATRVDKAEFKSLMLFELRK